LKILIAALFCGIALVSDFPLFSFPLMLPSVTKALQQTSKLPWWVWVGLMVVPIAAGAGAFWLMGQMDALECRSLGAGGSNEPDSTRLYCAQMLADRRTPQDLAEAIQLADSIAFDHPLRSDSDRRIQQWSDRLLELAEATYHDGKLDESLELLRAIPAQAAVYDGAMRRIDDWQRIWQEAQGIYDEAQKNLEEGNFNLAQSEARKLLKLPNEHWRSTRFQELVNQIQAAREDKKKQKVATTPKKPATDVNGSALNSDDLMARWNKEQEGEAGARLQKAQQIAAAGDVASLRDAIAEAQLVFSGTSHYREAQNRISDWNRRIEAIEDRPYLDRAATLANKGDLASLQAAISEANNIYFGRALYKEAQSNIDRWTIQAKELSDQPSTPQIPPPSSSPNQDINYRIPAAPIPNSP
jgi:hypothetical protein